MAAFTADGQRVSILIGPAGTGKSVTLGVARAAWEAAGYRVRGYAPFAAAASLQESARVESEVVAKLAVRAASPGTADSGPAGPVGADQPGRGR